VRPRRVTTVIAEAGEGLLILGETVVASAAVAAEAARLVEVLRRHHREHPLDPGMSLQALRAAVGAAGSSPPGGVIDAVLAHGAREGVVEQMDQERYAAAPALAEFRAALEATLAELGSATPAELRDRLGLTRKYLIPLLEWADRRGVTRREGDTRVLGRLTAGKGGP